MAAKVIEREIVQVDEQIGAVLYRIIAATSATVISAFEKRVTELENSELVLQERRERTAMRQGTFDEMFELAFAFLANPLKLWRSGQLELQKLVLRLTLQGSWLLAVLEDFEPQKPPYHSTC